MGFFIVAVTELQCGCGARFVDTVGKRQAALCGVDSNRFQPIKLLLSVSYPGIFSAHEAISVFSRLHKYLCTQVTSDFYLKTKSKSNQTEQVFRFCSIKLWKKNRLICSGKF